MLFIVALVTMLCWSYIILTSGINWSHPRSGPKKWESWCGRQNAAWTPTSSQMSILSGKLMAPNAPASCRGCLCMLNWWDGKNANDPFARAIVHQSLGQMLRQRFLPSGWRDSGLPERRSRRSTMKCISCKGYQAPTVWARANGGPCLGNLHFPGRMDAAEVGYHQTRKGTREGC